MIDLHVHTNHSDGTDTVEELLKKAEEKKLEIISITDHDSVGAYFEFEKNPELRNLFSGKIIVGSELKTFWKKVPIEVLGYGIDYKKIRIHKPDQDKIQNETLLKMKKVADELGLKYDEKELYIDRNNPEKHWSAFIIGTELLKHEENTQKIKEIGEFVPYSFYRVHQSNEKSSFYVDETANSINIHECISRIHEAGGLAFLAHGYLYAFENKDETIETILKETAIDGIEVAHSDFSKEEMMKAKNMCNKYNKFMSGGTDYHAKNKIHIELGTGANKNIKISENLISDWKDKVKTI